MLKFKQQILRIERDQFRSFPQFCGIQNLVWQEQELRAQPSFWFVF